MAMSVNRYSDKVKTLGGVEPHKLGEEKYLSIEACSVAKANIPDLEYHDLYNYLINFKSAYTGQQMKAYKSLELYKYFVAGFVNEIRCAPTTNGMFVIKAKVRRLYNSYIICNTIMSTAVGHSRHSHRHSRAVMSLSLRLSGAVTLSDCC